MCVHGPLVLFDFLFMCLSIFVLIDRKHFFSLEIVSSAFLCKTHFQDAGMFAL